MANPVFACILLFVAVYQWNTWFDCMLYTKNENLEVLSYLSYLFAKMLLTQQYLDKMVATVELPIGRNGIQPVFLGVLGGLDGQVDGLLHFPFVCMLDDMLWR